MKNGKKRRGTMKRIIAIVLAVLFAALTITVIISSTVTTKAADAESFVLDELETNVSFLSPIPLLCIRISFDPNSNGVDDWDPYEPTKLFGDKTSEYYGEQWIHSGVNYWSEMLFGEKNKSLMNYYKEQSGGIFYFYAGEETQGTVNDGIIDVAVSMKHPRATLTSDTADAGERRMALLEANKYVDFKSYDKNGNGYVDYNELAIVFVVAGYEHAYNSKRPSNNEAFATHAHYTSGTGVRLDDVYVTSSGHSGYVKCGEYQTATVPISVGTVAHELGHFLGAADLYDGGTPSSWSSYVSYMSLMASGSHGSGSNERSGVTPAAIDPFHMIYIGLATYTTVRDGEYTLYSRESDRGDYNIIRINTSNPDEYYLVENRYASSASMFDNTQTGCQGIVVWHIDENIVSRGKINNATSGHDPGVVVLAPGGISGGNCAFARYEGAYETKYTFTAAAARYHFPKSGTWTTSLDEGTEFPLVIEVLDVGSPEMRIKVTGTVDCAPQVSFHGATEATDTTIETFGKITDLCGGNVTSCGFILSEKSNPTAENGTVIFAVPNPDGTFSAKFEGLNVGTKYYCCVFAMGNCGASSRVMPVYTKMAQAVVEKDYYEIYLYSNYNNSSRKYTVSVYPGEKMKPHNEIIPEWGGYKFCGWYLDAELTTRYDMNYTQQTKESFSLYGKWTSEENARILSIVGASVTFNYYAEIGTTYAEPVPVDRAGYEFAGWYADEGLTTPFDFEAEVLDEQLTIYAKWVNLNGDPDETTEATTGATTEATTGSVTEATTEATIVPTTTATETTAGTTEPGSDSEKKGCGSSIAGAAVCTVIAAAMCAAVFRKEKKKDD